MLGTLVLCGVISYAVKRGIDFYLLAALSCLAYFYPILFFDDIVFITDSLHSVSVSAGARISLTIGIIYLLCVGALKKPPVQMVLDFSQSQLRYARYQANFVAALLMVIMAVIIVQNGFGLQGRDKTDVMVNLGYLYKTYLVLGAILISFAFVLKGRLLFSAALIAVLFDLMFGFRGSLAMFASTFLLTRPSRPGWKNVYYFVIGLVAVATMVIVKETAYFEKGVEPVIRTMVGLFESDGLSVLSLGNGESASISAVYNEVVKNDFSVSSTYLVDSFLSFFPFTNGLGHEAVGFASYFKGVLFGSEGESFASGMLSVFYALAGYVGVALCFMFIASLGNLFSKINANGKILNRVLIVAIAATTITTFFRSDLIYIIGTVRSIVVIAVLLKFLPGIIRFYVVPRRSV